MPEQGWNLAAYGNGDWPKGSWDLAATNIDELLEELEWLGTTVEDFKHLPAYTAAVATGSAPWLKDL